MPPARILLTKFGVLLVIVVGSRRRETSAPEVEKYGGCGGGETNDGDDDKGRDGVVNATGVATTIGVLCKTLREDNGEILVDFDFFL